MLSSYQFSERFTAQSILFDSFRLTIGIVRKTAAIVGRCFAIVSHLVCFLAAIEPYVLGAVVGAVLALGLFAVVSAIPVTFWVGLLIVGAFGWATFPRSKAVNHA